MGVRGARRLKAPPCGVIPSHGTTTARLSLRANAVPSTPAQGGLGSDTPQDRRRRRQAVGSSDHLAVTSHTLVLSQASGKRSAHARHAGDCRADGAALGPHDWRQYGYPCAGPAPYGHLRGHGGRPPCGREHFAVLAYPCTSIMVSLLRPHEVSDVSTAIQSRGLSSRRSLRCAAWP